MRGNNPWTHLKPGDWVGTSYFNCQRQGDVIPRRVVEVRKRFIKVDNGLKFSLTGYLWGNTPMYHHEYYVGWRLVKLEG